MQCTQSRGDWAYWMLIKLILFFVALLGCLAASNLGDSSQGSSSEDIQVPNTESATELSTLVGKDLIPRQARCFDGLASNRPFELSLQTAQTLFSIGSLGLVVGTIVCLEDICAAGVLTDFLDAILTLGAIKFLLVVSWVPLETKAAMPKLFLSTVMMIMLLVECIMSGMSLANIQGEPVEMCLLANRAFASNGILFGIFIVSAIHLAAAVCTFALPYAPELLQE